MNVEFSFFVETSNIFFSASSAVQPLHQTEWCSVMNIMRIKEQAVGGWTISPNYGNCFIKLRVSRRNCSCSCSCMKPSVIIEIFLAPLSFCHILFARIQKSQGYKKLPLTPLSLVSARCHLDMATNDTVDQSTWEAITSRIIPVSKWLITMVNKLSRVAALPNGLNGL